MPSNNVGACQSLPFPNQPHPQNSSKDSRGRSGGGESGGSLLAGKNMVQFSTGDGLRDPSQIQPTSESTVTEASKSGNTVSPRLGMA